VNPQQLAFPTNFVDLHETSVIDSFRPETFGYVKTDSEVAGFVPHGSAQLAKEIGAVDEKNDSHWQLTRLELVSLLKHDEPRVYIADTIPLMDEFDSLPHRPLDEFEAQALPQLVTEKDTVIEEITGGVKMLGAVRPETIACNATTVRVANCLVLSAMNFARLLISFCE
jgi:hypothetical protein